MLHDVAVYALIVALISVVGAGVRYWRTRGNQNWQTVEGRIFQAVHFTQDETGRGTGNYVRVMYSYQVNGEFYSGELLRSFVTSGQAERFADRYKRDMQVLIRVHPHNPELSALREDDNTTRLAQSVVAP